MQPARTLARHDRWIPKETFIDIAVLFYHMVDYSTDIWAALEQWSGRAFLAAGGVWIIDTVPYVLDLFVDFSIPEVVGGTLMLSALLLTVAGLLGLYVPLATETPRLALAGTVLIAVGGIVTLVTLVWVVTAGLLDQAMPPGSALALILFANILALFLFGGASIHTNVPSRTCGVLLFALAAAWGVWVTTGLLGATPEWAPVVYGVAFAVITSAIGYVRHTNTAPLDQQTPSRSPTTR
jgi:hypothetical protein